MRVFHDNDNAINRGNAKDMVTMAFVESIDSTAWPILQCSMERGGIKHERKPKKRT